MKIVVIGGSGLIGKKLVAILREMAHEVLPASPSTGVNTLTGDGLSAARKDASVVVDVANSPSFEDKAVLEFLESSGRNLAAAKKAAGVRITWLCRSSVRIVYSRVVTFARSWPKRN